MAALFSVMMPVFNATAYLSEAIDSVLGQTLADFEFLIMDDGSTDGTAGMLRHYADRDRRIRLFLRQHRGQIACRNELLQLARTDIVACADADDICLPDRFERQLPVMERDGALLVLGTAVIAINKDGARRKPLRVPTGSADVGAELGRRCCIAHPSCMMRARGIRAIGGYRPAYECAEDYDLFLRASERGKVDNLSVVGVYYRQHTDNVSHRNGLRQAISADLARATHALRLAGQVDPTAALAGAPDLDAPVLAALIPPAQMAFHRAVADALDARAGARARERAVQHFLRVRIASKQARAAQAAIVRLIGRRRFDYRSLRLAVRALSLGPRRLARLLLA
jgi:hypothetical protein